MGLGTTVPAEVQAKPPVESVESTRLPEARHLHITTCTTVVYSEKSKHYVVPWDHTNLPHPNRFTIGSPVLHNTSCAQHTDDATWRYL